MTPNQLLQLQSLPFTDKLEYSKQLVKEWYEYWNGEVAILFSGGKDSTVTMNIVQDLYPEVPSLFVDTGMEYPEIYEFISQCKNVKVLIPDFTYEQVIQEYGYPIINKKIAHILKDRIPGAVNDEERIQLLKQLPEKYAYLIDAPFRISDQCCNLIKGNTVHRYCKEHGLKPYDSLLACESINRLKNTVNKGFHIFGTDDPNCRPIAFWKEEDIYQYFETMNVPYCSIYGDFRTFGEKRTNCMYCLFGCHLEKQPNKIQRMKLHHPSQYRYAMDNLNFGQVLNYLHIAYEIDD